MVYADNAATTKLDQDALDAMIPLFTVDYQNPSAVYRAARKPRAALRQAREKIANIIGAQPQEIYFTSGGTESDNWALQCVGLNKGELIITSSIEHHAILNTLEVLKKREIRCIYLPPDKNGYIHPESLRQVLSDSPAKIVSIMMANNEIGTIQPIRELAKAAHEFGALFHTDAVQTIGHIPVNVEDLNVDLLSASAHKFNGPKGVGFLYIRNNIQALPFLQGGGQEFGLRSSTENIPGIVGMSVALENNTLSLTHNMSYLVSLERQLLHGLDKLNIDYIQNGGYFHLPGLLSLSFQGINGETLLHRLDLMGISVSTGSACSAGSQRVSHVLQEIGVPKSHRDGTIRISLGKDNTIEDVELILRSLERIIRSQLSEIHASVSST